MINKYDEALDRIVFNYGLSALDGETNDILDAKFNDDVKVIMSLIKKETPFKPDGAENKENLMLMSVYGIDAWCKSCTSEISKQDKYCSTCGQKIDWSGINDAT